MQKNIKMIITFVSIIIILIVMSSIFIIKGKRKDRVVNMYDKISKSQRFIFTMEEKNSKVKYKVSIAQRGTDINIDMNMDGEHTSTLILEGHAYYILHDEQEYFDYDSDDIDGDVLISTLKETKNKQYSEGKEEIDGKKYYYEEYEGITAFLMLLAEHEDATFKTRFYFDGDNIVFIKNIMQHEDEKEEELLKITLEFSVDDSVFEIPSEYAEA